MSLSFDDEEKAKELLFEARSLTFDGGLKGKLEAKVDA
jgi:hypothetical protein